MTAKFVKLLMMINDKILKILAYSILFFIFFICYNKTYNIVKSK